MVLIMDPVIRRSELTGNWVWKCPAESCPQWGSEAEEIEALRRATDHLENRHNGGEK
jgi:hypothetical protein